MPTLQLLQVVQTRLERGGGGGDIESKEGGMREGDVQHVQGHVSAAPEARNKRWQFIISKQTA